MSSRISRRQALTIAAGAVTASTFAGAPATAWAANDFQEIIKKFTGGKTPGKGRIRLDLPEIADNGNLVPLTVSVDSPMTKDSHVSDILVVADGNPRGGVVTFHFTPSSGVAEAHTRIRLATTQNVIAVARMNDGSLFMDSRQVTVTIGGCGG
jgi:sulfur-oxidizing protein SoxY